MFESVCEVERAEISDDEALAALCAELRADFAADRVVRYAVAFPATATMTLWLSALHRDAERRKQEVIAIEAHDGETYLRAQRDIVRVAGAPAWCSGSDRGGGGVVFWGAVMTDPMSRLEVVTGEIDRVFGDGHAAAHPELVIAVMNAASSDWAAQLIARSLREIAVALVEEVEEAQQHIVRAGELLRPHP